VSVHGHFQSIRQSHVPFHGCFAPKSGPKVAATRRAGSELFPIRRNISYFEPTGALAKVA
jgi:hypothetical protein